MHSQAMRGQFPRHDLHTIPAISAAQMREVDRLMVEHYHIELLQMMELAGRHLAHLAQTRFLAGAPAGKSVVVLAGKGGNGGGACVGARRLATWGANVSVVVTHPIEQVTRVAAQQRSILLHMGIPILTADDVTNIQTPALIIDGVIGYQLQGAPRDDAARLIHWMNAQSSPILALDLPSGLDATTGAPGDLCARATATLTLALLKMGLRAPGARAYVGELYLADISVPPELFSLLPDLEEIPPLFEHGEIVQCVEPPRRVL